jgi:hypothetical protein
VAGDDLSGYLADLGRRLPARVVEELADGLRETYERQLSSGLSDTDAADLAVAEFGDVEQIISEFVRQSAGRRTAQALLKTGPLVGLLWGVALVATRIWTWSVPAPARFAFGAVLLVAIAALICAASSKDDLRRTRLAAYGGISLVALDVTMISAALLLAPTILWITGLAIAVSSLRSGFAIRTLPEILRS